MPIRYPEDENGVPWLAMLMDAYAISDSGVREAEERDFQDHGFQAACRKGCITCCYQQFIPLTTLELAGIVWFICHKMEAQEQQVMLDVLDKYSGDRTCPMLQDGACAVYPVRPVACRQFVVYDRPCESREDVIETRPEHVLKMDDAVIRNVYRAMLPFYEIESPEEQDAALDDKYWLKQSSLMHQVDWPSLFIK